MMDEHRAGKKKGSDGQGRAATASKLGHGSGEAGRHLPGHHPRGMKERSQAGPTRDSHPTRPTPAPQAGLGRQHEPRALVQIQESRRAPTHAPSLLLCFHPGARGYRGLGEASCPCRDFLAARWLWEQPGPRRSPAPACLDPALRAGHGCTQRTPTSAPASAPGRRASQSDRARSQPHLGSMGRPVLPVTSPAGQDEGPSSPKPLP